MNRLSPYAVSPDHLKPRRHPESSPLTNDPFLLDRHRILTCSAFRRLEYKTQVFVNHEGDHYRTRLTHTLEVAQLARWLSDLLSVNGDLAEVVALAHDLGHPPFGHAGELALAEAMKDHDGFEHNAQALRVVEYLEHPYPEFRGLNLTFELRQCLVQHATKYDRPRLEAAHLSDLDDLVDEAVYPVLEGQVAALADRIAYDVHDLEDAVMAGLVDEKQLNEVALWSDAARLIREQNSDRPLGAIRRPILDRLLTSLIEAAVTETQTRLVKARPASPQDVRTADRPMVALPDDLDRQLTDLERFLAHDVYHHPRLIRMDGKARRFIARMFDAYVDQPRLMPQRYAARIPELPLHRVICDYLAGMTDRFCLDEYKRLFEPFESV